MSDKALMRCLLIFLDNSSLSSHFYQHFQAINIVICDADNDDFHLEDYDNDDGEDKEDFYD